MKPTINSQDDSLARAVWARQAMFQAWLSIAIWMGFGLLLEGFLGYKIPIYLQDQQRRELFRLAHTHGTFLGLVLLAAAVVIQRLNISPPRAARAAIQLGTGLMPFGFLVAGVWHSEGDPGLAIWLVPPTALLVIFGVVALALASRASDEQ
jgi:hypothetical protein